MADDKNQPLRKIEQTEEKETGLEKSEEPGQRENGPKRPEQETLIESAPEHREKEKTAEFIEDKGKEGEPGTGGVVLPSSQNSLASRREKEIEIILEKDLGGLYSSLTPAQQREFKISGEVTARKIDRLMEKIKFNAGKVLNLIRKWLAILPGVNKFFLEQEAKLKADEILKIYERH